MKPTSAMLLLLLLGALLISTPANAAKLYKWVDEQGRVSYQDSPPPEDSNFSETALSDLEAIDPVTKSYQDKMAKAVSESPLALYSIPNCDGCDLIRMYLEKRNIPYEDKNVENDREIQDELKGFAGRLEVPVLVVGERVLRGYSRLTLETELDLAGFPKIEDIPDGIPKPTTAALPKGTAEQNTEAGNTEARNTKDEPFNFDNPVEPATDEDIFKEEPVADK